MGTSILFGIPVEASTMEQVLARVEKSIETRESLDIGVVNAAKVVNMQRNAELSEAVLSSDVIYADGMSVVWASRVLGQPVPERIAGIDLMHGILRRGQQKGYRVFCLGATQDVLDVVCDRFADTYQGTKVVGMHHGYFEENEAEEVATLVRDAKADVLFVGITSPKKEQFMARWSGTISVPVVHGVGGSFDVVAGVVQRAPVAWQKAGFEWLYRLLQEPGRLGRRYLVTNFKFVWLVFCEFLKPKRRRELAKTK